MTQTEKNIDNIIKKVNKFKIEATFNKEFKERESRKIIKLKNESDLLKTFVRLIAFSQQANSDLVKQLIDKKTLDKVFDNYNIDKVVKLNPCDLVDKYWEECTVIRQRTKFFQIVMFARLIKKNKKVLQQLTSPNLPTIVKKEKDIDDFWAGFKELQDFLKDMKAPFLRETTTLLHFLLDTGYYCVKPDSAVMKAALKIGIVEKATGETNLVTTVRELQNYALIRNIKPAVLDLYLLIEGKQKEAEKLVYSKYYDH